MSNVRVHISVSADGYVAGPNQSLEHPSASPGLELEQVRAVEAAGVTHIKYRVVK